MLIYSSALIMTSGTLITLSSSSWITAWMGLELNMLGFIPLMLSNNPLSKEAMMKYFMIQATASSMFIMASTLISPLMMLLIFSAMMMKLGSAPLHFWLPNLIDHLSWLTTTLILTWQKLAPLAISLNITTPPSILLLFVLPSILISSSILSQVSTKKILVFSSISHLAWITSASTTHSSLPLLYLSLYSASTLSLILTLTNSKAYTINNLNLNNSMLILINLLNLGGFPLTLSFVTKVITLLMMPFSLTPLMMLLILSSAALLFSYLRLSYPSLTSMKTTTKITPSHPPYWTALTLTTPLSSFLLPLLILI